MTDPERGARSATGTSRTAATPGGGHGWGEPADERRPSTETVLCLTGGAAPGRAAAADGPRRPRSRAFQCCTSPQRCEHEPADELDGAGCRGGAAHPSTPSAPPPRRTTTETEQEDADAEAPALSRARAARRARAWSPDGRDARRSGAGRDRWWNLLHDASGRSTVTRWGAGAALPRARAERFVNPALVHSSFASTTSARPARGGRRRRGGPGGARARPSGATRTSAWIPLVGSEPVRGKGSPTCTCASSAQGARPTSDPNSSPGATPSTTGDRQRDDGSHRGRRPGRLDPAVARRPEQYEADHLDEAEHGQGGGRGERGERDRARDAVADAAVGRHVEERLQRELLGGEAVHGGSPAIAIAPTRNAPPCPRHAPQQPAELVKLEDNRFPRTRPRHEQQRLERWRG